MYTFELTPSETLILCFGSWANVADVCGLARGQVPQRWTTVPSKLIPPLVAASADQGRFQLDANMLTLPTKFLAGIDWAADATKPDQTQAA